MSWYGLVKFVLSFMVVVWISIRIYCVKET